MSEKKAYPEFLISELPPHAPMERLLGARRNALRMLRKYPGHEQWERALKNIDFYIELKQEVLGGEARDD